MTDLPPTDFMSDRAPHISPDDSGYEVTFCYCTEVYVIHPAAMDAMAVLDMAAADKHLPRWKHVDGVGDVFFDEDGAIYDIRTTWLNKRRKEYE